MNRKALSQACKLSLLAAIAAVAFFCLKIASNENRIEKVKAILRSE